MLNVIWIVVRLAFYELLEKKELNLRTISTLKFVKYFLNLIISHFQQQNVNIKNKIDEKFKLLAS